MLDASPGSPADRRRFSGSRSGQRPFRHCGGNAKVFNAAPFQRSRKMVPVPPWAVAVVAAA
jgi:hypothetical protein